MNAGVDGDDGAFTPLLGDGADEKGGGVEFLGATA